MNTELLTEEAVVRLSSDRCADHGMRRGSITGQEEPPFFIDWGKEVESQK